jgi:hypothetical protein
MHAFASLVDVAAGRVAGVVTELRAGVTRHPTPLVLPDAIILSGEGAPGQQRRDRHQQQFTHGLLSLSSAA